MAGPNWQDHRLVFRSTSGGPLDPSHQTAVKEALKHAGLPAIRLNDLRHTAATILLTRGVHVKVVSEMLGHTTITPPLDIYSHVLPLRHAQAAATMDAALGA